MYKYFQIGIGVFCGSIIGAVIGFIGLFLVCWAYDLILRSEPGGGLMSVGWVYLLYVSPVAAIIGGVVAGRYKAKLLKDGL